MCIYMTKNRSFGQTWSVGLFSLTEEANWSSWRKLPVFSHNIYFDLIVDLFSQEVNFGYSLGKFAVQRSPYTQRSSASILTYFRSDRNRSQPLLAGRWPPPPPTHPIHTQIYLRFSMIVYEYGSCMGALTQCALCPLWNPLPPCKWGFVPASP